MSYEIKKTDGTTLAIVPENDVVINAASIALVGRGATQYGVPHAQNFVHILENFAHSTSPAHALEGQLWYDKNVNALKVRTGNNWALVGGAGGGSSVSDVSGSVHVPVGDSSIVVFVAGGKVIAALSPLTLTNAVLPVTVTVMSQIVPLRTRFPFGLEAGYTLASDAEGYMFKGHVPLADQAIFAGGGTPLAATTYADLGAHSVALTIANNKIIAAYAGATVTSDLLPVSFTVGGQTMPFREVFPNGLTSGLNLGNTYGIALGASGTITGSGGFVTLATINSLITDETEARASAISELYSYADATYAEASLVNTISASFISATGETSLAEAIESLVAMASGGEAGADYTLALRSEVRNAITGATSFAQALQKLNTAVTTTEATASRETALKAEITSEYTDAIATATESLEISVDLTQAKAELQQQLEAEFETQTGFSSFAVAINNLKTIATGEGSVVSQDTDFRTRFTNALSTVSGMPTISTVTEAMTRINLVSNNAQSAFGSINTIKTAFAAKTGLASNSSWTDITNALITTSSLNSALASNNTTLKATIANEMYSGSVSISEAITNVLSEVSSNPDGSTSIIDSGLRSLMIQRTNEPGLPVTSIDQAVTKLMNDSLGARTALTKANSLETFLKEIAGDVVSLAAANSRLRTAVTESRSAAQFSTDLLAGFANEAGVQGVGAVVNYLTTSVDDQASTSADVTELVNSFKSLTGETTIAAAASRLWTEASAGGTQAGWSVNLNGNGAVAGLTLLADGVTQKTSFEVAAEQFVVKSGTTTINPFQVIASGTDAGVYVNGEKLTPNSVSISQSATLGSVFLGTVMAQLSGAAFATGPVPASTKVMLFLSVNLNGGDNDEGYFQVRRTSSTDPFGVIVGSAVEFGCPDSGGAAQTWIWSDTSIPEAGEYTYIVEGRRNGSVNVTRLHFVGLINKK